MRQHPARTSTTARLTMQHCSPPAPNPVTADADPVEQRLAPREQIRKQARQAGKVLRQEKWEGPTCTMCKSEEEERAAAMASAIYIWHWQRPKYLSLCCPSAVLPRAAPSRRDVVTALATGHARSATMGPRGTHPQRCLRCQSGN